MTLIVAILLGEINATCIHYETKTHENLVKLFMVNSQIFHSIFMVKLMAFSWSQCHEKDMKNPMKTL